MSSTNLPSCYPFRVPTQWVSASLKAKNIVFRILLAEASGNPVLTMVMKLVSERKTQEVIKLLREDILDVQKKGQPSLTGRR